MGESTTSQRRLEAAEKQRSALKLRKAGATFEAIARELGYQGPSGAYRAVMAGLRKTLQEPADELRTLEVERLDALMLGLWTVARKGSLEAIDRILKIMARRAKLLGLDAPTKVAPTDPSGEQEYSGMTDDERIAAIMEIIERNRQGEDSQSSD